MNRIIHLSWIYCILTNCLTCFLIGLRNPDCFWSFVMLHPVNQNTHTVSFGSVRTIAVAITMVERTR